MSAHGLVDGIGRVTAKIGVFAAVLALGSCGSHETLKRVGAGGRSGSGGTGMGGTGNTNGFAAAGNVNNNTGFDSGTNTGTGGTGGDAAATQVTLNLPLGDSGVAVAVNLVCTPGTLQVSGAPVTTQCYVELEGGTHTVDVVWIVDDTRVGSIGSDGVFRANGFVGGVVKVTAKVGTSAGTFDITTSITVDFSSQNNTGNVSATDIGKLVAGGTADGQFRWLYPYDKTVFPRGLQPPELQFAGGCADATYLKLSLPHYTYEQAAAGGTPTRITIPDPIWKGLTLSTTGADPVNVSVSKICGGQATGPIAEQWGIAPQKLKGVVYYATYSSFSLGASSATGELQSMVRLRFGSSAEALIPNTDRSCWICHSASANGERLLATDENVQPSYDLTSGSAPPPTLTDVGYPRVGFYPALTPDGRRTLASGADQAGATGRTAEKPRPSILINTDTGAAIATNPSTLPPLYIPAFSPDSQHVAFTNLQAGNNSLAIMDYDGGQNPPLFSNLREVANTGGTHLVFPSYIPDSKAVVYEESTSFYTDPAGMPYQIRLVETDSKSINSLQALNGYLSDNSQYLPNPAQDYGSDYAPTVMPRPIGGYYWVIFGSRRTYGNHLAPGGTDGGGSSGELIRKKIWVAAVDIDHWGKADPSHPAFFLSGQPYDTDAKRPFVALDPCAPLGASCETGADCCDGFCRETGRQSDGTPILECVPPPAPGTGCSNLDEYCATPADCCDPSLLCILNRCALPAPPPIF